MKLGKCLYFIVIFLTGISPFTLVYSFAAADDGTYSLSASSTISEKNCRPIEICKEISPNAKLIYQGSYRTKESPELPGWYVFKLQTGQTIKMRGDLVEADFQFHCGNE